MVSWSLYPCKAGSPFEDHPRSSERLGEQAHSKEAAHAPEYGLPMEESFRRSWDGRDNQRCAPPWKEAEDQSEEDRRHHRTYSADKTERRDALEHTCPGQRGWREPCHRTSDMEEPQNSAPQGALFQAE